MVIKYCHYCGVEIPEGMAKATNGYCSLHSEDVMPFARKIEGKFEIISYHTQKELEESLSPEFKQALLIICSLMIAGDKLVKFKTIPFECQQHYAKSGFAVFRNNKYFLGFATEWEYNESYWAPFELEITKDEIKSAFGKEWDKIKEELKGDEKFTYYSTSPGRWENLTGREFYYIKRDEKIIFWKLGAMN